MDMTEIPMILFTVLAQMCVGAFLVLGAFQLLGNLFSNQRTVDKLTDPILFVIGPAMVLGLGVSMLHMHDVTHTLNVLRHWDSSWLSREIIFGSAFAGAGFVFCMLQWWKKGPVWLRQLVATVTALLGVGLLVSMSMIYYSLITVPAWHHWFTPLQFVCTAVLLGSLLVAASLLLLRRWNPTFLGRSAPEVPVDPQEEATLVAGATRWLLVTALVAAGVIFVATPLYVSGLAAVGGTAVKSAQVYTGATAILRFSLLGLGAGLMGALAITLASPKRATTFRLAVIVLLGFLLTLVAELMGRGLFYEAMMRVGI